MQNIPKIIEKWQNHYRHHSMHPIIRLLWAVVMVIFVIGLTISGISIYKEYSLPPEEVIVRALNDMNHAPSYTFHSISKRLLADKEEILNEVWGEKNNNSTHLKGKIHLVNGEFEVYQIDDQYYRQDNITKEWLTIDHMGEEAAEKLMQEINPLAMLNFTSPIEVEFVEKEKVGDVMCKKYHVAAYNENEYMTALWHNFFYTLWIDKKGQLCQAEIIAVNKENETQQLMMQLQIEQSENYVEIEAPTTP